MTKPLLFTETYPGPILVAIAMAATGCTSPVDSNPSTKSTETGATDTLGSDDSTATAGPDDSTTTSGTGGMGESGTDAKTGGTGEMNEPPVAVDDVYTVRTQEKLKTPLPGLLANDSDPDGSRLTVSDYDRKSTRGATVMIGAEGDLLYTAGATWGWDEFAYTIEDEGGAKSSAKVRVWVSMPAVPLSAVAAGEGGFIIDGASQDNEAGWSVRGAGDVNGDGLGDVVVGASWKGPSYVVFGKTDTRAVSGASLAQGTDPAGFALLPAKAGDRAGWSVSGAGDVNADGLADLVVGGYDASPNGTKSGISYVVFGRRDVTPVLLADVAAGTGGFAMIGEAASHGVGYSVSDAGDVNADGLADVVIGTYAANAAYVVFGKTDTKSVPLSEIAAGRGGFVLQGVATGDFTGRAVGGAGDVNGDGLSDVIVGAHGAAAGAGTAYVVFGKVDTGAVSLASVAAGSGGFALLGENAGDTNGGGVWVSGTGDVNGDGRSDVIVCANRADPFARTDAGTNYVVFGKTSGQSVQLADVVAGKGGFALFGAAAGDQAGGCAVSGAGDVNGDGLADLIVGAENADPAGESSGTSYVVFGKAGIGAVQLKDVAAGMGGFALHGAAAGDQAGKSVAGAGDVNADGLGDLIVGANAASPSGTSSGRSYVVFSGNDSGALTAYGRDTNDTLTGTAEVDVLVAGRGNDTLVCMGGPDVLRGGAGDDVFVVRDGAWNSLDGGSGTDTVRLEAASVTLDLASLPETVIQGIEVIDITGTGDNLLRLSVADLVHASPTSNLLVVHGDAGDKVSADLRNAGFAASSMVVGSTDYTNGVLRLRIDDVVNRSEVLLP